MLGPCYLDGSYSEAFPHVSQDEEGLRQFFKQFSFPGQIGSHCTPETPGSIHEGGELGYVLSHACGSVFDNPELIAIACVGDGEAETGPLATSWHINKFLNPIRDGAVLPVLYLNGYKVDVERPGAIQAANTAPLGAWIGAIMQCNPRNYRLFGPDETASNRLQAVYATSKKCWMADVLPEDEGGSELSPDGRVIEMLSEHTLVGMMEGYLLTGRCGWRCVNSMCPGGLPLAHGIA